jgi:hypothetical protein
MGSARFDYTFDLTKHRADAMIRCGCGHEVRLDYRQLQRLLRRAMPMRWHEAERRLVCVRCGARGQRIVPVPQSRSRTPPLNGA